MTEFDPVVEALYATNLISSLENEDYGASEMQNLFQFYADQYMLVNINSSIIDEVISFQKMKVDHDIFMQGESRYKKVQWYFFDPAMRLDAMKSFLSRSTSSTSLEQFRQSDRGVAFIADMDAQFLYVPKTWIRYILMIRLAKVKANLIYEGKPGYKYLTPDKYLMN